MVANFPAVPLGAYLATGTLLALMLVLVVLSLWLLVGASNLSVTITDKALRVQAPFYGRDIPLHEIRADAVAVVDLTRDRFVPGMRTNGIALPGLRLGRYKLARGAVGHVVITTSTTALAVPLADGSTWLLGVRDPVQLQQALLRAINEP